MQQETTERQIFCGVPQGSVLGSFLFILYNNDFSTVCKKSTLLTFGDDTTVENAIGDDNLLQQMDIEKSSNWFNTYKLTINCDNCDAINFGKPKKK